jgi:hypothetical protein
VFERLDDAGLRTAGTTFLIYRGRHRIPPTGETALARLVNATVFRHAVYGPRELFYADLFATRRTGCRSQLGLPGARDAHAGCVGAYLVEHDLFDFLLLSLPDNDTRSHRFGPDAQLESAELADLQLQRLMDAAGGTEEFFERYALVVLADHAHSLIEERVSLHEAFGAARILLPEDPRPEEAELAMCPGQRFAMVYALDDERRAELRAGAVATASAVDGVDLVLWREGDMGVVRSRRGELRFAPDGPAADSRGRRWRVDGELGALAGRAEGGQFVSDEYPDALARAWSALTCPNAGDVLMSAAPGYEFIDWGGVDHVGAGSHGSLHRDDSLGPLAWWGCGPEDPGGRPAWGLEDVLPMVLSHFRA